MKQRVAVIGAGAAGLAAARQVSARADEFECVVFEMSDQVGGTWVYTDQVGKDEFGLPVHSSMYKSLRTNLPKEVMGYPDYPIPEQQKSYLYAREILQFLNDYADHFGVRKLIKFRHHVEKIKPVSGGVKEAWEVTFKNLLANKSETQIFDAIMICNGHYNTPFIPEIEGQAKFSGKILHSHDYREPSPFVGQRVVVVGAGPSGMDLALEIARSAKEVVLSHHNPDPIKTVFPPNVRQTPDIIRMDGNKIHFRNGTNAEVDVIFYCTGYCYSFPFLDKEAGVYVKDNHVQPLYKHLVHINKPSMCFVGLPFYVCAFSMFDLQSRFFIKVLDGSLTLPSSEDMLAEMEAEAKDRREKGLGPRQGHMMGPMQGDYYEDLAKTAGIEPLPPVLTKLHNESSQRFLDDLCNYREDVYRIVDSEKFVQIA
ncbi:senecionine N-oxygenase [Neocloeon triangulifer]|uniref:senecionine N-oxygenase n=1 Tax=Neocloeon triangulifer TaxID=2078957 RepID=UPI00286F3370|nr:senecionine N-oxygenase [Neocloeon triangulifer]